MQTFSSEDLFNYFQSRNNRFRNSEGMEFGMTSIKTIWTHFNFCDHHHGPLAIDIFTEHDSEFEFVDGFNLKELQDIDKLGYYNLWMRYLNGFAEIKVTPFELDASLNFKIVKQKTIIFSLELHFYDEVYEHLTLAEDFERYINSHENRLRAAEENRYRISRM